MRKCRNWQTSKTKDLVSIALVWVQVPSSAHKKRGSNRKIWSFFLCANIVSEELAVQVIISHVSNEKYKNKEGIWMDKLACIRQVLSLFLYGDCRGLSVTEGRAEISLLYCRRDANIRSARICRSLFLCNYAIIVVT